VPWTQICHQIRAAASVVPADTTMRFEEIFD
jgi:hypothetical protein